jgi:hypothetical protein
MGDEALSDRSLTSTVLDSMQELLKTTLRGGFSFGARVPFDKTKL